MEKFKELTAAVEQSKEQYDLLLKGQGSEFVTNLSLIKILQLADHLDTELAQSLHDAEESNS